MTANITRAELTALGDAVTLTDSNDAGLELFSYKEINDASSDTLKQCRGVIFNGENLILKTYSYTPEYNEDQSDEISAIINDDNIKLLNFFESHEGTLIRLFFHAAESKWYVATHKKLNAFASKWSSNTSFGDSLEEALAALVPDVAGESALTRLQTRLDRDYKYVFLLRNNADNRIVCDAPESPTVYHVGTFDANNFPIDNRSVDIGIPKPRHYEFETVEDMLAQIDKIDYTKLQGLVAFDTTGAPCCKILKKAYQELFNLRGNESNLVFRYMQLRMDSEKSAKFASLYPERIPDFRKCENDIYGVCKSIYADYKKRYIDKLFVTVPKEEYAVIKRIHNWYLADRDANRLSLTAVIDFVNEQSACSINHMVNRFNNPVVAAVSSPRAPKTGFRSAPAGRGSAGKRSKGRADATQAEPSVL
jgi:hypothetical protein